jgi:two-component system, cell cycle sensor histidine kinase and response regulator CckA
MGNCIVQILLVEDSVNDELLLLAELKQRGYSVVHRRVETREEFLKVLTHNGWDAVIADYSLPHFSGPEALKLVRERNPIIPFIMVSGVYGEEHAVSVMREGANDYILKGNLARLAPALERELDAAQERRVHHRTNAIMQHFTALVQSSEDAIYSKSLDSCILTWNPGAERMFGYPAYEMIGRSVVRLFPQSRRDEMLDTLAAVRRGDTVTWRNTERLHMDGSVVHVSVITSPIRNPQGEIIGVSSIARDISRQQLVEDERQELFDKFALVAAQLNKLTEFLPICASCERIRDDREYWERVSACLAGEQNGGRPSSLCPECTEKQALQLEFGDRMTTASR